MKKQLFTNTILYTRNSLVPVIDNKIVYDECSGYSSIASSDINAICPFGSMFKHNYKCNIIWVPENNNANREILIMPQYKFGYDDGDQNSWINALTAPVSHPLGVEIYSTRTPLEQMIGKISYTDNMSLVLTSSSINDNLTINSSLSNFSSILSESFTNFYYTMAFRFLITLDYAGTPEDSIYTHVSNVRFGRPRGQIIGEPPILEWDLDPNGNPYPRICTFFDTDIDAEDGQTGGDYYYTAGGQGWFNFNSQT